MFKFKKMAVALAALGLISATTVRARTRDVAFPFRMGAGFPGDINRTKPFSAVPGLIDVTNPPAAYGYPVLVNTAANSFRGFLVADQTATRMAGVMVRPYPVQQQSGGMSASIGSAAAPTSGVMDALETGFIMVKIPAGVAVTKDGPVYVWCAASSGNHILGGFEGATSAGNTCTIANARFNGPADASGNVEIQVWPN